MNDKKIVIRAVTVDDSLGFIEPMIDMLKTDYEVQLMSSPGNRLIEISEKYNVKKHAIIINRRISPLKDIRSLWDIYKVFKKEKPDMVHSMTPKAGLLCMIAGWLTRVPVRVHTFTGLVWPIEIGFKRKILMFTDWLTCACATHIIPEGAGVMNDLQNHITKKPMKVLGYGNVKGVDMERFSSRPEVIKLAEKIKKQGIFTYVFVGRLVGDKGINELVKAFESINYKYPHTRLILVGKNEEDLDPLHSETIDKINNNKAIQAVGPKSGDDLLAYYAASDCFVFPSYREGFPNVVLEAGAMGLPSIVTDINGSREIIISRENGLIVPSKNVEALYDAMKLMLLDTATREKMAANARHLINSRFEKSFVQDCLVKFYKEVLK